MLEATHLRLALELKEEFKVKDLKQYLSGVLYPDSRYITKIPRTSTHNFELVTEKDFYVDNDFRKGWATHLMCDRVGTESIEELFPEFFVHLEKNEENREKRWCIRTAIKIFADIHDAKTLGMKEYARYLSFIETPNGEDPEKLEEWYQGFRKMYEKDALTIDDEFKMWEMFELPKELLEELKTKALELKESPIVAERIEKLHTLILDNYKKEWGN